MNPSLLSHPVSPDGTFFLFQTRKGVLSVKFTHPSNNYIYPQVHVGLGEKEMQASHGILTIRKGKVFVIASQYGVDSILNVGSDGLRRNGTFTLQYDGQTNSVALVGKEIIFHMHLDE